jgi:dCMP deaminase
MSSSRFPRCPYRGCDFIENHAGPHTYELGPQPDLARPSREQVYMEICYVLRKRSTCLRGKVGAILVVDQRIIATGYNGAPPRAPHCFELGCDTSRPGGEHVSGCQRAIHAEANAIAFAARHGARCEGATLICTHGPCLKCAQLIVSAGIAEVIYETPYRLPDGLDLLDQCSVPARRYES